MWPSNRIPQRHRSRAWAPLAAVAAAVLLFVSPVLAATLLGLVDTGELYASTNNGVTWTIQANLPVSDAVGLAAGSSTSELYIVSRSGSLYRSSNGGGSWSAVGALTASDVTSFTLNYDGAVLALTESGTLYRSTDQGASFTALAALTAPNWVSLTRGPVGRLYALTETGEVAESQDQVSTWTIVGAITVSNAVAIRRKAAELYILTKTGEVYRSIDYGRAWLPVGALASSGMSAIVDVGDSLIAAALTGEVASSVNGVAWSWVGAINQLNVVALGVDTPLVTGVADGSPSPPRFAVGAPRPNPRVGAGGAAFPFTLSGPDRVSLALYSAAGRLLASRAGEWFAGSGAYALGWEPEGLPAGTYFVRLTTASGRSASTKWTLAR